MKLTKLYIHNYKSFYDTTIELDKLNIVVGENNSGKSNLIDILEFIDIAMSKDIERAIDEKGGYDRIKNYSAVGEEKVVVRATFSDVSIGLVIEDKIKSDWQIPQYITFSFSFSSKYSILTWSIKINTKKNETIHYLLSNKKYFEKTKEKKIRSFVFTKSYTNEEKQVIKAMTVGFTHNGISLISTYYFDAQKIRTLSNQDSKYSELLKDGSNLGKVLYEIKEKDKSRFEAISNSLITTVNEIDGIEVYKVAGNYIIAFKERGKEPIPIHIVSDGTINFLATMTALNQPTTDFLLAFEEPERHLHFKVVNYLLESFRNSNKQIIITTHSTEMLKYANLNEVIFIYRNRDGDTKTIRADRIPNLKEKMEYMKYERCMTLDEMLDEDMVWDFEE